MTVYSQSIPLMPISGGTVIQSARYGSSVMLTPTRQVVVFIQSNPARRVMMIVDNPNGFNSTTAPSVYNNVYNDGYMMTNAGSVKMVRLNDSAFMIASNSGNGSSWFCEVFTVQGQVVSFKTSNTFVIGDQGIGWENPLAFSAVQQSIAFIPLGDNTVLVNQVSYENYTSGFGGTVTENITNHQLYYNGTTLTQIQTSRIWGFLVTNWGSNNNANWVSFDVYHLKIPGSNSVMQVFRGVNSRTVKTDPTGYKLCYFRPINPAGAGQPWTYGSFRAAPDNFDVAMLDSNTYVVSDWASTYYVSANETARQPSYYQTAGNQRPVLGGGVYATGENAGDAFASTPFVLPINTNYHVVIDRRHFTNPAVNPFQMKVVRREDSNMMQASPASTGPYGFTVNVPKIQTYWDKPRPFLIGNDIFWSGVIEANFAYNVIKQPNLPSS